MTPRRHIAVLSAVAGILLAGVFLPTVVTITSTVFFVVGIGALLLAVWVLFQRVRVDTDTPTRPDPELPRRVRVPGSDFDTKLDRSAAAPSRHTDHTRNTVRDRLTTVAQAILTTTERLAPGEATERIESGTWTDNRLAATFLQDRSLPTPTVWERLRYTVGRASPFTDAIEATVNALAATAGIHPSEHHPGLIERFTTRLRGPFPTPVDADDTDVTTPELDGSTRRRTHHWRGISALAIGGLATGLLFETPGLLLAAAIGVGYTAYAGLNTPRTPDVSITHDVSDDTPTPGSTVTVTVTAHNNADHAVPDLRLIDGVPPDLGVATGSPRHTAVLAPNESVTYEYTIDARRGTHVFTPTRIRSRSVADTVEVETSIDPDTTIHCHPTLTTQDEVAVRDAVTRYVGGVPTQTGGHGIEFHSTREYRHGDPINRIDWHRLAKNNRLSTVAYREEHATNLAVVVDTRAAAYVAPGPYAIHAADRSASAAATIVASFLEAANTVGLVTFGPDPYWLPPTADRHVQDHLQTILTEHDAFAQHPPTGTVFTTDWLTEFRNRIPQPTQVVFLSPVCDAVPVRLARSLDAYGYPVTLISPDPTTRETTGQLLAHLERRTRLDELRQVPLPVLDWAHDEPLAVALARGSARRFP